MSTLLVVDDDPVQRRLLEALVRRFGYAAETAAGGEDALARIADPLRPRIGLMILDLVMPDLDGMSVLARMRAERLTIPVIALTTPSSLEAAAAALRAGAVDFIVKPEGAERLKAAIANGLRLHAQEMEIRRLAAAAAGALSFSEFAGGSLEMERAVRLGERAAKSALPVLLQGEAGAGKNVFARAIHAASDRRGRPFVTLNCAVLAGDAAERALFGSEGGLADGRAGKYAEAQGGTLYLDDIGALPLAAQGKVLRVLRELEAGPAGARRPTRVDVRLMAAATANLIEWVKAGRFREDLFYRLNAHPISLPPLRRRPCDIAPLARGFCARFAAVENKRLRGLSAGALGLLSAYYWPGNVRQLENAVFRAVVLAEGDELTVAEFPQIAAVVPGFDVRIPAAPRAPHPPRTHDFVTVAVADPHALPLLDESGDLRKLGDLEAEAIRFALGHCRGRMSAMARKLGIGRSTLYRKMRDFGLAPLTDEAAPAGVAAPAAAPSREDAAA
jgi:DNA-binding NtrC family response regulator